MKLAAIYGPHATVDDARPFYEMVSAKWTAEITDDLDAVLIFGGDGTIHRHLARLSELKIPMLPVPSGSGNDFASGLGIDTVDDAMHALHKFADNDPNVRAIDLGAICDGEHKQHIFCNVAHLGLDAEVNRRANKLPSAIRGHGGYILSLLPSLVGYEAKQVTVKCNKGDGDAHNISKPAMLVAFANGRRYGHGLQIAPRADMSDGFMDVCFVGDMSKMKLGTLFPIVYFGQHLKMEEIEYFRCRSVRVETPEPTDVYADGEFICKTPVEISIIEAGLRVITPHI